MSLDEKEPPSLVSPSNGESLLETTPTAGTGECAHVEVLWSRGGENAVALPSLDWLQLRDRDLCRRLLMYKQIQYVKVAFRCVWRLINLHSLADGAEEASILTSSTVVFGLGGRCPVGVPGRGRTHDCVGANVII